ncbi:hypothetical protein GGD41_003144 [Paraburkholderia bryophila]|uniref:Phosphate transporter n=1 Tax=Paraburkholderia bryophila TaxID=420952 RepID=A0A7Y9W927_9BURK|nr:hypothetical protein [Paraburkholderia bryophila]
MPELSYPQPGTAAKGRNLSLLIFFAVIAIGAAYCAMHLVDDLQPVRESSVLPYLLLCVALLIALGFEFVNGFHDTANAVATVIYTHSLTPNLAVVWSGTWNFLGVLTSTGAVAFGVLQLLPVELILQVGSSAGFAMVFALLIAAIIWNLGTWYFGLPSSSSHTLIGSIIGVGLMNQLMHGANGTSGVDWNQALGVGKSLLFSPLVGFLASALLLLILKAVVRIPALYAEPKGKEPPPFWIRSLLILTCTGVSFAHGSNDGQKGMGPHHADPDRHGADRVCAEQGGHAGGNANVPGGRATRVGHARQIHARRRAVHQSARRRRSLCPHPSVGAGYLAGIAATHGADRSTGWAIGLDGLGAARYRR